MYLKKKQPSFVGCRLGLPCWLSGEHLPIMTPRTLAWVPRCVILWLDILIMGSILWLCQTQGLFMKCRPDPDVKKNNYDGCTWTVGHKEKSSSFPLSFNLLKVQDEYIDKRIFFFFLFSFYFCSYLTFDSLFSPSLLKISTVMCYSSTFLLKIKFRGPTVKIFF